MTQEEIGDLDVEYAKKLVLSEPPKYSVLLFNDDYTPMEFVVDTLQKFFSMHHEAAVQVMLAVHESGKGLCGIFPKGIAETKAHLVSQYALENEHPLKCDIEPVN